MSVATAHLRRSPSSTARPADIRRRLVVGLTAVTLAVGVGGGTVLASRGGDPASTPAARQQITTRAGAPITYVVQPPITYVVQPPITYVVQPGDTLWAIAERFHGGSSTADYVDRLIDGNGGATRLAIGQQLALP